MTWADRLRQAFEAKDWSKAELSRRAKISYDSVNKYLSGAVDKPRGDALDRLAAALGVDPLWLEKGIEPDIPLPKGSGRWVEFAGHAQAGQWFEVDVHTNGEKAFVAIQPDPRFLDARQYAWQVEGDSMDRAGVMPGSYVLGVDLNDYVDKYGEIQPGDLVVVERTRFSGQEREITVKRYWPEAGRILLCPDSHNPVHKAIEVPENEAVLDPAGEPMEITIKALVIASINLMTREKIRQISDF